MSFLFGDKDLHYQHMDKLIEFLEKNSLFGRAKLH